MLRTIPLLLLISMFVPCAPAAADWIRTREGALIETKGPWKVKGSVVVFTSPKGRLSSIRLSEVDLDGSAVATAEAKNPPPPAEEAAAPAPKRAPVLELTNKDISRAGGSRTGQGDTDGEDEEADDDPSAPDTAAADQTMRVVSWRQVDNTQIDGIEIIGTLQNLGRSIATDIAVTVTLFDDDGTTLESVNAFLGTISLAPSTTTTLRALFPDIYTFTGEPEFSVRNQTIEVQGVIRPRRSSGQQ